MFREIESKPFEYLVLFLILLSGIIGFIWFNFDPRHQRSCVFATGGAYLLWSLYHHYRRGDLHLTIIIEYLVFILLGIIVLSSTLVF